MDTSLINNRIPKLRNDLILHKGPAESDGSPTWTLYDPSGNRFFRIGWVEFECLSRFITHKNIDDIVASINSETALDVVSEEVMEFANFLTMSELVVIENGSDYLRLANKSKLQKKSFWKTILHSYLFLILPLVNPDNFLRKTYPLVKGLYTKKFFNFILILLLIGLYLTAKRWDEFFNTFMKFFSWEGLALYIVAIACVKIIHELSHAYMATKHGVRVSSMGVAFIVLYPVLFTETTGAWKLSKSRERLLIAGAGVLAELSIAAIALMLWHIFPDGIVRSTAFFMATVSLVGSLFINLNPFMRFDGYYLLGDALGIDNLQARAFSLARWNMRRFFFDWKDAVPEVFDKSMYVILLVYAYGTWIYRFFLFIGIAVLVYMLFFKPLGPFLMAVELIFFLGMPIYREIIIWWKMRDKMDWNKNTKILSTILALILLIVVIPWRGTIDVPAIIKASDYRNLHVSMPARVDEILVEHGSEVRKGDLLLRLTSVELEQKIIDIEQRIKSLKIQKSRESRSKKLIQQRHVIDSIIIQAESALLGYKEERKNLEIYAPFDGHISDVTSNLHEGRWVDKDLTLLRVVNYDRAVLQGYVHERDVNQVSVGDVGVFYPDNGAVVSPIDIRMTDLSDNNAMSLSRAEFSGNYGGAIAVQEGSDSGKAMIPRDTLYLATFSINDQSVLPRYLLRGHISLKGNRRSMLLSFLRYSAALVIRESGF